MQPSTGSPIYDTVIALAAIVSLIGGLFGMAMAVRVIFFPVKQRRADQEYVTRAELEQSVKDLDTRLVDLKTDFDKSVIDIHARITMAVSDLQHRILEVKNDVLDRFAKQEELGRLHGELLHSISLKVERLVSFREAELAIMGKIKPPPHT